MLSKFLNGLHPKVLAAQVAAAVAQLAVAIASLSGDASWRDVIGAVILTEGPIVVAWIRRADPVAGDVAAAVLPEIAKVAHGSPLETVAKVAPITPAPAVFDPPPASVQNIIH